jgi:addiction module RelB/DinJ family antitoxin
MKDAVIRARIDAKLKADAVAVLAACGLEVSDAIRLFLMQVIAHRGLPFAVRDTGADPATISAEEFWAMKRESQARDHALAVHEDVPANAFHLVRELDLRDARVTWPSAPLDE